MSSIERFAIRILLLAALVGGSLAAAVEVGSGSDRVLVHLNWEAVGGAVSMLELGTVLGLGADGTVEEDPYTRARRKVGHVLPPAPVPGRWVVVRAGAGESAADCAARLNRHPWVRFAEVDGIGTGGATLPNDANFGSQWHHRNVNSSGPVRADMHSTEAWDLTTGSTDVVLAILDTGLAAGQPDFAGRTVAGYDFVNDDDDPADDHGHGTAVAGAASATGNNQARVAGVDWHCRIMPLKVLDHNNSGQYSWWTAGIEWAVDHGADVINLSAGGGTESLTMQAAIEHAIEQGVIVVTITHNDGAGTIRFPGRLEACITVGATDANDAVTGFSNYGPQIDLVAPGTNIYTLSRSGGVTRWWGTSFAAPLVSGTSCLLRSVDPTLTQTQMRTLLCAGADDQVGDELDLPGFDTHYGHGRLNAYASLQLATVRLQAPRIDDGITTLRWSSPSNAVVKTPFTVEQGLGGWAPAPGHTAYDPTQTTWSASTTTGTIFRLRVLE